MANVVAAYKIDIQVFDSSVAGLGGCPDAPGAVIAIVFPYIEIRTHK